MTQLMRLDSKVFATFSEPMDPFGNYVDENGESVDPRGAQILLNVPSGRGIPDLGCERP